METFVTILKFIIAVLPIVALALVNFLINLKKEKRYLQLPLPVISLIYGIVALIFVDKACVFVLDRVIYFLIENVPFMSFLDDINWAYGVMYLANVLIIGGFLLIKFLLLPILSVGKPHKNRIGNFFTSLLYTYDEKDDKWYIKEKFNQIKTLVFTVYVGAMIFSSLLFALTCYFVSKATLSVPFYPAFGLLILGEIYFVLCGIPKGGEDVVEIAETPEEDDEAQVNYASLVEFYEKYFPDRLSGKVKLNSAEHKLETAAQLLLSYRDEYEATASHEARLLFMYFSNMLMSGQELDDGMIASARNIMEGKNVLYLTPFYEDTTKYVFMPVTRHLMKNKKILIILGRTGSDKNVIEWFRRGLSSVNNFENIWKINYLSEADENCSIAVLPMKDMYNQKILTENEKFLESISMVFIMDPTRLLGTMQVGLSNVVGYLKKGVEPQYIAYDRNCDGLVDSLSHVLGSSIEQVVASEVGSATTDAIIWEADGKNLHHRLGLDSARYLGMGTEIAALAISKDVDKVNWFAYEKFPATDMKWIMSQYYGPLCRTMEIPVSQSELDKHIEVSSDLWSLSKGEERFVIAEDEYNNAYEIIRQFSSRATKQAFINVLSQNYLLRDYMSENADIFTNDPKAIPNISADYQRVRINVVCRIVMKLLSGPVYEQEIVDALQLIGINSTNVSKDLSQLIFDCFITDKESSKINPDSILLFENKLVVDEKTHRAQRKRVYSIANPSFVDRFLSHLQVVYYVAEDELDKNKYLNSILYGHVYQKYLPGTFTVFDGKYYEVVSVTKNSGVIVRRAADHITKRRYYRQIREYSVNDFALCEDMASRTTFGNVVFERGTADISVKTDGYYELSDYGNLKNAAKVTTSGIPQRDYHKKNVIRFKLNGADAKVRFTVAALINELFVTLFPDMHEYIAATTMGVDGTLTEGYIPALRVCDGGVDAADDGYVYIIEDSLIDMGLLINADRYFSRIMEIITDYLGWHTDTLKKDLGEVEGEGEIGEGEGEGEGGVEEGGEEDKKKKKGCLGAIPSAIGGIFKRKKKKGELPADEGGDEGVDIPDDEGGDGGGEPSGNLVSRNAITSADVVDDNEGGITGEDDESVRVNTETMKALGSCDRKPYRERYYLLYGYETVPEAFDVEATLAYLTDCGYADNYLKGARDSAAESQLRWYNTRFEPGVHYCDFCGARLEGEISILKDGRERCAECEKTAITKVGDFKKLYKKAHRQMEDIFGIKIKTKISIRITNAEEIAREMGYEFVPGPGFDGRALGFAQRLGNGKTRIVLENGAPAIETEKTLVHEMTHCWQYENMLNLFDENKDLVVTEGMAVWTEAQYLMCIGQEEKAAAYVECRRRDPSEYGQGMIAYVEKYPLRRGPKARNKTPFCKPGQNPLA